MTARRRFAILFGKDGETMSKEIGIIDADLLDNGTRHPNLALMKISGDLCIPPRGARRGPRPESFILRYNTKKLCCGKKKLGKTARRS